MKKMYCFIIVLFFAGAHANAQSRSFGFAGNNKKAASEFLIFYSSNCQWCTNADKAMQADNNFQKKLLTQYNVRTFDIGTAEGKEAAAKMNVSSVPTFIRFNPDHTYITINGFSGTKGLADMLFAGAANAPAAARLLPPGNDECAGAITISGTSGTVIGDNTEATNSAMGNFLCQANWQKDVWYKFTLASAAFVNISVNGGTMSDPILGLYLGGNCASQFFQIDCNDDGGTGNYAAIARNLNAGTYHLRIGGYYTNAGIGTFNIVYNFGGTCANGILDNGEQCDDGNLSDGDGCSTTCTFENQASSNGVAVNTDGTPPNPSAMLDVKSSNKGMLVPRVTTAQRTAIVQPAKGLFVFDVTTNSFWYYSTAWSEIKENEKVAFHAVLSSSMLNLSDDTIPILDSITYNDGNNFANSTFTVPEDGLYSLSASMTTRNGTITSRAINLLIQTTTNKTLSSATDFPTGSIQQQQTMLATTEQKLTAGTKIYAKITFSGNNTVDVLSVKFWGHKIY